MPTFSCCDLAGGGTLFELETPPREFGGAGAEAGAEVAVLPTFETFSALDGLLLTAEGDPVGADTLAATGGGTARAINCCSLRIEEVPGALAGATLATSASVEGQES